MLLRRLLGLALVASVLAPTLPYREVAANTSELTVSPARTGNRLQASPTGPRLVWLASASARLEAAGERLHVGPGGVAGAPQSANVPCPVNAPAAPVRPWPRDRHEVVGQGGVLAARQTAGRPHALLSRTDVSGTITGSTTWTLANSPYVITGGGATVDAGASLTIEPGVVVKFEGAARLVVNGQLQARGTITDPIYFTSLTDDQGGDTNGDGSATMPARGEWLDIWVGGQGQAMLEHCVVRYGGYRQPWQPVYGNVVAASAQCSLTLKESTVEEGHSSGLYLLGGATIVLTSTIRNNDLNGIASSDGEVLGSDGAVHLQASEVLGNGGNGIATVAAAGRAISVSGCTIAENGGSGVVIAFREGWLTPTISTTSVLSNGYLALDLRYAGGAGLPVMAGNTVAGNLLNGIGLLGPVTGTLRLPAGLGVSYVLTPHEGEPFVVPQGARLVIEPGVVVKGGGTVGRLVVQGELQAKGTAEEPIYFTSWRDNSVGGDTSGPAGTPARGDWSWIWVAGQGKAMLGHCQLRYGGYEWPYQPAYGMVVCGSLSSTLEMHDCLVSDSCASGLWVDGGSVTVRDSTISRSHYAGLRANNASLRVEGSTIKDNEGAGVSLQATTAMVEDSSICDNGGLGLYNASPSRQVLAAYNWWGHPSGPYNAASNPEGLGDEVSSWVAYEPWLVAAPGSRLPTPLVPGEPVTDTVGYLQYKDYSLQVAAGQSLVVEVVALDGSALWAYSRVGDLPLWTQYDQRLQQPGLRGSYDLLISPTLSGTYYLSVYGQGTSGGAYRLTVRVVDRYLAGVSPGTAGNQGSATLCLTGLPFVDGMSVRLQRPGQVALAAASVTVQSPTSLWAQFDLQGAAAGVYDVAAVWPSKATATLTQAFTVTQGRGGRLEAHLSAPAALRPGQHYVLWLEYGNTGDADLPAPLFVVSSPWHGGMRLSPEEAYGGGPLQVLGVAQDGPAGVLRPGSYYRLPIQFRTPVVGAGAVEFDLQQIAADSTAVGWEEIEGSLRPADMDAAAWAIAWDHFRARVGSAWASYVRALDDQATYLARYGSVVCDAHELLAAMLARAEGAYLVATLASSLDAYATAPRLPLAFARTTVDGLEARFRLGPFGRGWSHSLEYSLSQPDADTVVISGPAGASRTFRRDHYLYDVWWDASPGDSGWLADAPGGYVLSEKDGLHWYFGAGGRLTTIREPNGNAITLSYDGEGRLSQVSHSDGQSLSLAYNARGRISALTDEAGLQTQYQYDASGEHLVRVLAPGPITTTYTYKGDAAGASAHALASVAYADGTHQYFSYDAQGRLSAQWRDGGAERVEYTYDALGTVVVHTPTGGVTTLRLGSHGQPLEVEDGLGRAVRLTYDGAYNLVRTTAADGATYAMAHNRYGDVTAVSDPLGQLTGIGFRTSPSGPDWVRDAQGNLTDLMYGAQSNLTQIVYPDGTDDRLAYDAVGNVISATNRGGASMAYTYDAFGRLTGKTYPGGRTITYTYDARGDLLSAADSAGGAIEMQYDGRGFLSHITYADGHWLAFEYNDAGRRTRRTGDDGYVLNYHYDSAGRLLSLSDGEGGELVRYAYDSAGRLASESKGNGTYTTYAYDSVGQLIQLVNHAPGGGVQSRFDYTHDGAGNRVATSTLSGTTYCTYDALGRLTGVSYPGGREVTYAYDAAGNRLAVHDGSEIASYTANALNQYTEVGGAVYGYDADGNLTSRADEEGVVHYEYDVEGRLVTVTTPFSGTWHYTYDALGNRAAVEHDGAVVRYLYDPAGLGNLTAEYDGAGALVARYVHGLGLAARVAPSGQAAYYAFDGLGNTCQVTDDAGAIANAYAYDPFGLPLQTVETVPNPFRYVGQLGVLEDGSGLIAMRARCYDPAIGRFTTPDPLNLLAGPHLYTYAANNPLGMVDPSGLVRWPQLLRGAGMSLGGALGVLLGADLSLTGVGTAPGVALVVTGSYALGAGASKMMDAITEGDDDRFIKGGFLESVGAYASIATGNEAWAKLGAIGDLAVAFGTGRWEANAYWQNGVLLPRWYWFDRVWGDRLTEAQLLDTILSTAAESGHKLGLDRLPIPLVAPRDPNEKMGPPGRGDERTVQAGERLAYTIYFENVVSATAPAQQVLVVDQLDPSLDAASLRTTEVAFGAQVVSLAEEGSQVYTRQTVPDYRPEVSKDWWVDVTAECDLATGRVRWVLRTLDPDTGEPPADALAGFLPPNDESGRGEGHVSFTVSVKAGVANGTRIGNTATITFDSNEPIETNEVWNTVGLPYEAELPLVIKGDG